MIGPHDNGFPGPALALDGPAFIHIDYSSSFRPRCLTHSLSSVCQTDYKFRQQLFSFVNTVSERQSIVMADFNAR